MNKIKDKDNIIYYMKKCAICYEYIYYFCYQSNCDCRLYYHLNCINEWYLLNRSCIQCRKKDTNSNQKINKQLNTTLQIFVLLISCIIIIIVLIYNNIYSTTVLSRNLITLNACS